MPQFYYPITEIKPFSTPQGRGSCYQQFASYGPHGAGDNRFTVIFDEDVDFRVFMRIDALFKLAAPEYLPIKAIGERKGALTVIYKGTYLPGCLPYRDEELTQLVCAIADDLDTWPIKSFTEYEFAEFAGHLCRPPIDATAFLEATTWNV